MTDQIELLSLIGEHVLDAVDTSVESTKRTYGDYYEDCELVRFRLDGKVYTAIEDPSDGYRSSLGSLILSPNDEMRNVFPPVRVLVRKKDDDRYGNTNETIQFIDLVTGKTVLEIGTDNSDDYYPSFVGSFSPENMATNATSAVGQGQG